MRCSRRECTSSYPRMWFSKSYLHSPVNNLESFYHTAQWPVAFNNGASGKKHNGGGIREFREKILGDRRLSAILGSVDIPWFLGAEGAGIWIILRELHG